MFDSKTTQLLAEHVKTLPLIACEKSLRHDMDELVAQALPRMRVCVVDDVNTEAALGEKLFSALKGKFAATHLSLQGEIKADDETIEFIRQNTKNADALIAVGSGTINDLCKYTSFLDKKPYLVFPTAASMNGYLSANASITFNGYKKTVPAQLPQAVFCDMSVIAAAPLRLSKSGLGDAAARPTAQADWLLSHHLLGTEYNNVPFELIVSYEAELFDNARGIAKADTKTIELLTKISLLSGLGMTIAGGSYPASQGEHMIAHTYEMSMEFRVWSMATKLQTLNSILHGETIGVTALTMAALQQRILRNGGNIRTEKFDSEKLTNLFGEKTAGEAKDAFTTKQVRIHDTKIDWDFVRSKLESITIAPEKLESILLAAETYTKPAQLGWSDANYKTATDNARYLRDRFTFLDIV